MLFSCKLLKVSNIDFKKKEIIFKEFFVAFLVKKVVNNPQEKGSRMAENQRRKEFKQRSVMEIFMSICAVLLIGSKYINYVKLSNAVYQT